MLTIRENFNTELGQTVWTIERSDGEMLLPADGIKSLNYSSLETAEANLPKVQKSVENGGGQW